MISDERMKEIIKQAKEAALIHDFTPCGMGLPMRTGFSNEVYSATLAALIEQEAKRDENGLQSGLRPRLG